MGNEVLIELYKQHRVGQDKYAYFLLAVAASAVGFAVQKTTGVGVQWSQLPLAVATGLWVMSFFFGCKHLLWSQAALTANIDLIKNMLSKAMFYGKWQFLLLVIGAVFFLVWHVLEMVFFVADDRTFT